MDISQFNYAIWSAVSAEHQAADDKVSLQEQISISRQRVGGKGWRETSGPYIVPGESRTRYVNLRDAEEEIPQLKQLLDDAQARKFDILVIYDYNRLRDLIDPVAKTLAAYGVQVYSINQPVEPLPPGDYNQYANDSESIMRGMAQIITRSQISDMRRKFAYAMPKRITERGLPQKIPYGYTFVARDKPAVIDPQRAPAMTIAKDMVLAGQSLRQVVERLEAEGYPPPRGQVWYPESIRRLLKNPYYAGIVHWRSSQIVHDPRNGTIKKIATPERRIQAQGRHEALWSEAEHRALLHELRRVKTWRGRMANQFTGLLVCGGCGKRMGITYINGRSTVSKRTGAVKVKDPSRGTYRCRKRQDGCHAIKHPDLVQRFTDALVGILTAEQADQLPDDTALRAGLERLIAQRDRLSLAYAAGAFELDEFLNLKRPLDVQIDQTEQSLKTSADQRQATDQRAGILAYLRANLDDLRDMIANGDPQAVNHTLRAVVSEIIVRAEGIEIVPR